MKYWQTWHFEEGEEPTTTIETSENEIIETLESVMDPGSEEVQTEESEETGVNVEVLESVPDEQDSIVYDHLEEISKNCVACVYLLSALLLFTILKTIFTGVNR